MRCRCCAGSVTPHDSGTYICRLANGLAPGVAAATVLEVQERRPAAVAAGPARVELVVGRPGTIPCTVLPSFTFIQWSRDGEGLAVGEEGLVQTREGGLLVPRVEERVAGNYTCRPYNAWGSAGASGVVQVVVRVEGWVGEVEVEEVRMGTPRLVGEWVEEREVELGERVVLECAGEGEPHPEVVWEKDGRAVVGVEGVVVEDRGVAGEWSDGEVLVVGRVRVEHLGRYTCRARSGGLAQAERSVELVLGEPGEQGELVEVHGAPGAVLQCPLPPDTPGQEYTVVWWRGGTSLPLYTHYSSSPGRPSCPSCPAAWSHSIDLKAGTSSLHLGPTLHPLEASSTLYTCRVSVRHATLPATVRRFQVVAEGLGASAAPSQRFHVSLGEALTLRCGLQGITGADIHWYRGGRALLGSPNIAFYNNRTELAIGSLGAADVGNYTCSAAKDQVGSAHHTVELTRSNLLEVREAPADLEAVVGEEVELPCRVSSSVGRTNVTWWRGEELLGRGEHLTLANLTLAHAGNITCRAANNETELVLRMRLEVMEEEEEVVMEEDLEEYEMIEYEEEYEVEERAPYAAPWQWRAGDLEEEKDPHWDT